MNATPKLAKACWFVGAAYGGVNDQTPRFLAEGIWENGYKDRYLDQVRSIQPGDQIAIKSSYTRKRGLPFDSRGQTVSVMAIKAIGTVTENLGDGRKLKVDWIPIEPPREWYFYTNRLTVWRVLPGEWITDALLSFAFEGKEQDIAQFCNAPYWRERFGDVPKDHQRFKWTKFYESVADKLLAFKNNRVALIEGIHKISTRVGGLSNLNDQFSDGTSGPLKDICPFTTFGIFNRGITDTNRKAIALELAKFLGVTEPVPDTFEGIPVLNNMMSWFFGYEKDRQPDDIDALWNVFEAAIKFAEAEDEQTRQAFIDAHDKVNGRYAVGWNLTCGLYWIRPWNFLSLDQRSRLYIARMLGMQIGHNGPKRRCNALDYLTLMEALESRFQEEAYSVHSFPECSLAAWMYKDPEVNSPSESDDSGEDPQDVADVQEKDMPPAPFKSYTIDDILAEGCFIGRDDLEKLLERLLTKKNLILQGPPGTGKTWLAKRLAFALMGQCDGGKVRALQFHPNLSYEDFVRGWRPAGDGCLSLVDGPFMEMIIAAKKTPSARHVVVIEEINRGNPAQIFGEMLTLMEADKRTPSEALELCYCRRPGERVFVPDNLYVIGTMNIADRSLALVDFALRRRFAFVELEPRLGKVWRDWVNSKWQISVEILNDIEQRILTLNEEIAADSSLGRQFRIGHSYVTPPIGIPITDALEWFRQVVETEIGPLLEEYWFDDNKKARNARQRLLEGLS